jgi:hypothetical protein
LVLIFTVTVIKQCGSTITTGILTASLSDAAQSPVTTVHRSLIIRIVAYHPGNYSLKIQGFIGIVALQGASGSTVTVLIQRP